MAENSDRGAQAFERPLALWLISIAALVFAMVLLGGATRLTHSGLSMVDWRPVTGWLPPLSEAEWSRAFEAYKQFPEYQKLNRGIDLAVFKGIFWFEYTHRLLGRLIGLAFALPFLWFWIRGRIRRRRVAVLLGLLLLGGLQGLVGWWMVKSGLIDRPDVSHYRLTLHLGLAVAVFAALIWVALDMLGIEQRPQGARAVAGLLLILIFLQILLGAMVAGLDAGFVYNSFPMMGQYWWPPDAWALTPPWRNLVENGVTLQFAHRTGALVVTLAALWACWQGRREVALRVPLIHLLVLLVLQVGLGIATLVLAVPVVLGVAHQGAALLLLAAAVLVVKRS